ncbi:hypothetical protein ACFLYR_08210 [Chloroflexota bacterium]
MPDCPNCGQPTKRTEDSACQWCGYPLLSKSYRKIPKTYKQLKEERLYKQESLLEEARSYEQLSHLTEDTASTKIEFTVEEIFSICTSDQAEATARFKEKILSVTGVVARIVADYDSDIYYVSLTGAQKNEECSVNCMFDEKNSSQLNELIEGQTVTINGEYDSYELNILIRDCALVSLPANAETPASPVTSHIAVLPTHTLESEGKPAPGPATEPEPEPELEQEPEPEQEPEQEPKPKPEPKPEPYIPALEITFDELLAVYAIDQAAADERFGKKILKITGIVNRIEVKDYLDLDYINLTSAERNIFDHVRCFFDKKHGLELNQLIKGQKVTVQGTYDGSAISMRLKGCVLVSDNI